MELDHQACLSLPKLLLRTQKGQVLLIMMVLSMNWVLQGPTNRNIEIWGLMDLFEPFCLGIEGPSHQSFTLVMLALEVQLTYV